MADVKIRRKPRTAAEYARLWDKHVLTSIGAKKVNAVTTAELRPLHRSMDTTPYLANRVMAMLGAFFSFAAKEGARPQHDNPAHGVEFFPEQGRERFLTPDEFRRLGAALTQAERDGLTPAPQHRRKPKAEATKKHIPKKSGTPIPANPYAVAAIRLLALTGCRENEILSLRWEAVDLEHGYLRLADTKTGKSNRPLGESAATVLRGLKPIKDNPYVFPGAKAGEHLKEIKRVWFAVRQAANLDALRLHDLRHSYASVPASTGESLLIVRSLLGHARVATTERYAHLGADPVKRAADRASNDIAGWLAGRQAGIYTDSPSKVTPATAIVSRTDQRPAHPVYRILPDRRGDSLTPAPMIHVAGIIRRRLDNILNCLGHRITNAVTEGLPGVEPTHR